MTDAYVGELRIFAFGAPPTGWLVCAGQLLSTSQYDILFYAIGNQFGGDGVTTFAVPDLRGRVPIHRAPLQKNGFPLNGPYVVGQSGGVEHFTLHPIHLPAHNHAVTASASAGNQVSPAGGYPADAVGGAPATLQNIYAPPTNKATPPVTLATDSLGEAGGNASHTNMQPFLALNCCIAFLGIVPSAP